MFLFKKEKQCSRNFQTRFHNADHLLYCPQMSVFSFHAFLFSYISLEETEHRNNVLALPYSYNWQIINNKINEKRSQECQSMDPEYVTGQINSRVLQLLLRQFYGLIFATSRKS